MGMLKSHPRHASHTDIFEDPVARWILSGEAIMWGLSVDLFSVIIWSFAEVLFKTVLKMRLIRVSQVIGYFRNAHICIRE